MQTNIIVKLQVEGTHNWPDATDGAGAEMHYLEYRHRHMFHIVAKKEVFHDDRDVEFIMFKRDIIQYLENTYYNKESRTHEFGAKSCEMLAKEILKEFDCVYVSVFEDNENGAEIYTPDHIVLK